MGIEELDLEVIGDCLSRLILHGFAVSFGKARVEAVLCSFEKARSLDNAPNNGVADVFTGGWASFIDDAASKFDDDTSSTSNEEDESIIESYEGFVPITGSSGEIECGESERGENATWVNFDAAGCSKSSETDPGWIDGETTIGGRADEVDVTHCEVIETLIGGLTFKDDCNDSELVDVESWITQLSTKRISGCIDDSIVEDEMVLQSISKFVVVDEFSKSETDTICINYNSLKFKSRHSLVLTSISYF